MDEDALQDVRRVRLRAWIDSHGGTTKACAARGILEAHPSYPSHLSQILGGGSFGPRAARTAERRLGMPDGYLDRHDTATGQSTAPLARVPTLEEAVEVVGIQLAAVAADMREALATNMAGWARDGGRGPWQQVVLQLLATPQAPRGKRPAAG